MEGSVYCRAVSERCRQMVSSVPVFVLPFPPLLLKLCYDNSSSKRPIVKECIRSDGKLPLARATLCCNFQSCICSGGFPFSSIRVRQPSGTSILSLHRFVPSLLRFSVFHHLLGSKLQGAGCLSGKDLCAPPHLWGLPCGTSPYSDDPPGPRSSGPSNQPFNLSDIFISVLLYICKEGDRSVNQK